MMFPPYHLVLPNMYECISNQYDNSASSSLHLVSQTESGDLFYQFLSNIVVCVILLIMLGLLSK